MAKIANKLRLFWVAPADTDVVSYNVYAAPDSDAEFFSKVQAGTEEPHASTATVNWLISGLVEGNYQFVISSVDDVGNESDPYQHEAWKSVPLDLTPPQSPSGGGIERLESE